MTPSRTGTARCSFLERQKQHLRGRWAALLAAAAALATLAVAVRLISASADFHSHDAAADEGDAPRRTVAA